MIDQMSKKHAVVQTSDNKIMLDNTVYDTLSDAYNAFLAEEFSAERLKQYLSGGYQDDLSLLQQYALNDAMTTALKKYNSAHKTNYTLDEVLNIDAGGFADLV